MTTKNKRRLYSLHYRTLQILQMENISDEVWARYRRISKEFALLYQKMAQS